MLKEVSTALILGDVNIRIVSQLRKNVKQACNFEDETNAGNLFFIDLFALMEDANHDLGSL